MTKREDIVDGTDLAVWGRRFGLVYTCNAGWIDLGHLNPYNPRPEIGAANLWRQICAEQGTAPDPICLQSPMAAATMGPLGAAAPMLPLSTCDPRPDYHFPDGRTGYLVRYRQDTRTLPGRPGQEGLYIVKHGLSIEQKKSVALAIFVEISLRFETLQRFAEWLGVGKSGFSQEDLVSDLIGFYIAVGEVTHAAALAACHPISKRAALAIWDREGAVGDHKNRTFTPQLAKRTGRESDAHCSDECSGQPQQFPKLFTRIRPAHRGSLFTKFAGQISPLFLLP